MIQLFVLSILAYITVADIRTHRITNRSTLILGLALFSKMNSASFITTFISIAIAFALCALFTIGMGDFKLFSVLVITQGSLVLTLDFLHRFFLVTLCVVTFSLAARKNLASSIAFAPCIVIPFGMVYLGI